MRNLATIPVCFLVLAIGTAHAVEVRHDGVPIFFDGFEGVPTGGLPDPNSWEILFDIYGGSLEVVDGSGGGDPAPFEGSQYVKLQGDSNATGGGPFLTMEADLGSMTTGTIHSEWMMYIRSNSDPGGTAGSFRTSGTAATREPRTGNFWNQVSVGQVQGIWDDINFADYSARDPGNTTDVPYTADTWQKWEVDIDLGTADDGSDDTYEVTVDGISSGTLPTWREHPDVGSINFGLRGGNTEATIYYVDAVPSAGVPPATDFTWDVDDLGNWAAASSWDFTGDVSSGIANNPNHTAIFGNATSNVTTAVTNSAVTLNRAVFNSSNNYFISGAGSVNFAATTDPNMTNPSIGVDQGSHEFQVEVALQNDATVGVASGSTLEFVNRLSLDNNTLTKTGDGTLLVNSSFNTGGGTIVNNGGVIGGGGVVGGSLDNAGGTVAPGNSPGILTVNGNYTQGATATLAIEVEGTGAGTGHDQLAVNGDASLDGTLDIQTGSTLPGVGASPGEVGDTYVIVTANSRSGEFSTVDGRHAGAGIFYDVDYHPANVTLGAFQAQIGDADGDRDVDITDFNTLSGNFDPSGVNDNDWTTADFDLDGDVDITDFNGLSANFAPGGYAASGGQVPEPGTLALLAMGFVVLGASWIRRQGTHRT